MTYVIVGMVGGGGDKKGLGTYFKRVFVFVV